MENTAIKIQLTPMLDIDKIKQILATILDREVPVLTLNKLGIIGEVQVDEQA